MFTVIGPSLKETVIPNGVIWLMITLVIAFELTFYSLRSVAIYTMAKKKEIPKSWIAFIPMVWLYTACKIVGKERFFGKTYDKLAVLLCVIFSVAQSFAFLYQAIIYFPVIGNFLAGHDIYYLLIPDTVTYESYAANLNGIWLGFDFFGGANYVDPYARMGLYPEVLNVILRVLYYSSSILDLARIVITISVYVTIFKRYVPGHFLLFTLLSVFMGIFPPLVFAIRNKQDREYVDYVRERYGNMYANRNQAGGPYNVYGRSGPYTNNQQGQNTTKPNTPPDPFEEFADNGDSEPFGEFNNNNNEKDDKDK